MEGHGVKMSLKSRMVKFLTCHGEGLEFEYNKKKAKKNLNINYIFIYFHISILLPSITLCVSTFLWDVVNNNNN